MEDYEPIVSVPTGWAISFLFFLALVLGIALARQNSSIELPLSIGLISAGLPTITYGLIKELQYKDIFDYEPTIFWKKESNGKRVRAFLRTCDWVGLYCLIVGVVLFFDNLPVLKLFIK